jgi:lipopolysaccharide transport system permease protein
MRDVVYDSTPQLRHPRRFARAALEDLRESPSVGYRLFRANLKTRYRRSWLGYLWLVVPSLAAAVTCAYLTQRRVISAPDTAVPYVLFVLTGTMLWQVFLDAFNAPLQQLTAARQMITRSRAPHEAIVLAAGLAVLLNTAIRLVILIVVVAAFGLPLGPSILLAPVGLFMLAVFGLGLGLAIAPLAILYDDVGRAAALVMGFGFFLTPILYPPPSAGLLRLNPVTPLLDATRAWLFGEPASGGFVLMSAVSVALLLLAWLGYRLSRPHLVVRLG